MSGITTVDFIERIARRSRDGDFTKLSLVEQKDVIEAANAALPTVYDALPEYFREQTQGFALPAPSTIAGVGVTQFSKIVTGANFAGTQFGQSVVLAGDPAWNQIAGPNLLQNPYMGPTAASIGATIYGDAFFTDLFPLDRIIGDPQFADLSMGPLFRSSLQRNNGDGGDLGWWLWQKTIGLPQRWWTQVYGNAQGNVPLVAMRFSPAPDQAYSMKVRIGLWPKRLTFADYQAATMLPCPDQFIEKALIPLARKAFMSSPAYKKVGDEELLLQLAAEGEEFLKNQPAQIGVPSNNVGTPKGF